MNSTALSNKAAIVVIPQEKSERKPRELSTAHLVEEQTYCDPDTNKLNPLAAARRSGLTAQLILQQKSRNTLVDERRRTMSTLALQSDGEKENLLHDSQPVYRNCFRSQIKLSFSQARQPSDIPKSKKSSLAKLCSNVGLKESNQLSPAKSQQRKVELGSMSDGADPTTLHNSNDFKVTSFDTLGSREKPVKILKSST